MDSHASLTDDPLSQRTDHLVCHHRLPKQLGEFVGMESAGASSCIEACNFPIFCSAPPSLSKRPQFV
jgi:hypothetical protein